MVKNADIEKAMTIKLDNTLPEYPSFQEGIRRAPDRGFRLTKEQTKTALKNALRYVPEELHGVLAKEFLEELKTYGRIYAYRYRPQERIYAKPVEEYRGNCLEGKAIQLMIDNNLDFDIALYPYELVTYGETGSVCQNWLQYALIKRYLEELTHEQTLVIQSGHPLGLFPSKPEAPRVIVTNALMIGMFDNLKDWEVAQQMGVANYGQMTAGGFMYIGPQGIVHGTFNTIINAGRKVLGIKGNEDLKGKIFVSSGLGGMSGAQPKAIEIANGIGIIAEVDKSRIMTRYDQGFVSKVSDDLKEVFDTAAEYKNKKETISIAYHGNIVDLLQYAVDNNVHIELLSDQTSCHNVYDGGYCPQGVTFEERTQMLSKDRDKFVEMIDKTLKKHFELIQILSDRGTYFFDYGNSFLKAVYDAGVMAVSKNGIDEKDG
ncbi:MAG: urocanate hydratase, partial [Defluviitaleaceae bacterium]|nr:urocanate hydratase [Defluviitaleaceae bacterium]